MAATSSTARSALASLPRALRISPSTPITRQHLLALYKEQLRVADSFSSYNFRQYFVRRTKEKFRVEVPSLLSRVEGTEQKEEEGVLQALKSAAVESKVKEAEKEEEAHEGSIYTPSTTPSSSTSTSAAAAAAEATPEAALRAWYAESLSELAVMARSAIVNQMYEAPRLVVEGVGRVMVTGGGGAGQEAGYGGGGQPADGQPGVPPTPAQQ